MATLPLLVSLMLPLLQSGAAAMEHCSHAPKGAAYEAGIDAHGKAVAPADLADEAAGLAPRIGDKVTLNLQIPASRYNDNALLDDPFAPAELNIGAVEVRRDGSANIVGREWPAQGQSGEPAALMDCP